MTRIDQEAVADEANALLAAVELNKHMLISEARAVLGRAAANRLARAARWMVVSEHSQAWRDSESPIDLMPAVSESVP